MTLKIPDDIRKETTRCRRNFLCLETGQCGDPEICGVEYANGKNVLFLKSNEQSACDYRVAFGGKQVCTCPIHFHLFQKDQI